MWRRREAAPGGEPPPPATLGQDDFTGSNTDPISGRTASGGGTWTEHTSYASGDAIIVDPNRARNSASPACFYHSGTPATADYDVSLGIVMRSDNNSSLASAAGRIDIAADTMYYAGYATSGNVWFINKALAGVTSSIGATVGATLTVDQEYTVKLEMRGTTLKLYVDGVETISRTDSDISAAGKAGFRLQGGTTPTAGLHIDNFLAQDAP